MRLVRLMSMYSGEALHNWDNEQINVLIDHFGKENDIKTVRQLNQLNNPEETKKEWYLIIPIVVKCGYQRFKIVELWGIINKLHGQHFPNSLKLAALAVTVLIHTADGKLLLGSQNKIISFLRNRISAERLDGLIMVRCKGGQIGAFEFDKILDDWRQKKNMKISSGSVAKS